MSVPTWAEPVLAPALTTQFLNEPYSEPVVRLCMPVVTALRVVGEMSTTFSGSLS